MTAPFRVRILSCFLAALLAGCATRMKPIPFPTAGEMAALNCQANLREMQAIKLQWAADEHKSATDEITRADLMARDRYILTRFECPAGGNYTWGRVGEPATCSVPGHTLK
jgi:hypothetical protein